MSFINKSLIYTKTGTFRVVKDALGCQIAPVQFDSVNKVPYCYHDWWSFAAGTTWLTAMLPTKIQRINTNILHINNAFHVLTLWVEQHQRHLQSQSMCVDIDKKDSESRLKKFDVGFEE